MTDVGVPLPHDIFTDNHRWGDLDEWNRTALSLHEQGHKTLPIRYTLS